MFLPALVPNSEVRKQERSWNQSGHPLPLLERPKFTALEQAFSKLVINWESQHSLESDFPGSVFDVFS